MPKKTGNSSRKRKEVQKARLSFFFKINITRVLLCPSNALKYPKFLLSIVLLISNKPALCVRLTVEHIVTSAAVGLVAICIFFKKLRKRFIRAYMETSMEAAVFEGLAKANEYVQPIWCQGRAFTSQLAEKMSKRSAIGNFRYTLKSVT